MCNNVLKKRQILKYIITLFENKLYKKVGERFTKELMIKVVASHLQFGVFASL